MSESKELALKEPDYLANINPLDNESPAAQDDIKVPNIIIAQPNGSCMKDGDPGFIDGIRAGQFYNNVTREVLGKVITRQFIHYFKVYNIYKGTPASPEWVGAVPEADFLKLRNRQFNKDVGIMTTDLPDQFIKENWRFVLSDDSFDFSFMNIKPGGIQEAKNWVNMMQSYFSKGKDVMTFEWEIPTFLKASKTTNNSSYQIDGSHIKHVGYVSEAQYQKAKRIKEEIKRSQDQHLQQVSEDY